MITFIEQHFKLLSLGVQMLILVFVLSLKMNSCQIENDMRTTKKQAKELNSKTLTKDDAIQMLQQQQDSILIKEKELDRVRQ